MGSDSHVSSVLSDPHDSSGNGAPKASLAPSKNEQSEAQRDVGSLSVQKKAGSSLADVSS